MQFIFQLKQPLKNKWQKTGVTLILKAHTIHVSIKFDVICFYDTICLNDTNDQCERPELKKETFCEIYMFYSFI